jgi:hypothetical protein
LPKPKLYVVPGSTERTMRRINSATSSNANELKHLDDHYKKLDDLKKDRDKKNMGRGKKPAQKDAKGRDPKKEPLQLKKEANKPSSSKGPRPRNASSPRVEVEVYKSSYERIGKEAIKPILTPVIELKLDDTSLDITDAQIPSILRVDAPEFVPVFGGKATFLASLGD